MPDRLGCARAGDGDSFPRAGARMNGEAESASPLILQLGRILVPLVVLAAFLAGWEALVYFAALPPYVLPSPSLVVQTLIADRQLLLDSLGATLLTTVEGFAAAVIG